MRYGNRHLPLRFVLTGIAWHVLAIALGAAIVFFLGAPLWSGLVAGLLSSTFAVAMRASSPRRGWMGGHEPPQLPTAQQLDEAFAVLSTPESVVQSVSRTVRRFVACKDVEFLLLYASDGAEFEREVPSDSGEHLLSAKEGEKDRSIVAFPAKFRGQNVGVLRARPSRAGAHFTDYESDVLQRIADRSAVAVARAVKGLEAADGLKLHEALWRDEREALLETVAAEIVHEVRYPINFFRSIFKRGSRGEKLDAEDVEIGAEETERLERLVGGLRRLSTPRMNLRTVSVSQICYRAHVLLRDRMGPKGFELTLDGGFSLLCDQDKVTQVLVNLLSNSLDAAGPQGKVGVGFRAGPRGAELAVWDDGPGFAVEPSKLFAPWYTTKGRGKGLGLAITHRLVGAHGWTISAVRRDGKTVFTVSVPVSDLVSVEPAAEVSSDEVA